MHIYLYIITAAALVVSVIASRKKTLAAFKIAATRFFKVLPVFLVMLILFAVSITFLPNEVIGKLLGRNSGPFGVAIASVVGSITLMPGFIAFPLCGALLGKGVPYMVLSAFTTTLMNVGILTYPLERRYLGRGVTLVRNGVCLAVALIVAVVTGLVFGEIRL
ncbi:MAG: hypothetical protein K8S55_07600 [Phycisphaerae bacterium]|nr:hypothetical protein [Phycisphaerae bacterium]